MFEKMLINTDMNDIRNILNLLEDVGLTESRGLLYRDKGDVFFKGSDRNNPDEEIVFDTAKKLTTGGSKDVTDIFKKQQTTTSTGVGREKR